MGLKLVSRKNKEQKTIITVGGVEIGGGKPVFFAGPCSVESEEQIVAVAKGVKASGAQFLRGGAFKPRTNPYSFQGLKHEGLKLLAIAREETGLPIVTEVTEIGEIEKVAEIADIIQIGARNAQNYDLLREVGRYKNPVFLKRGFSMRYDELIGATEYIMHSGNLNVILCERGIRTFETALRNTLDIASIPVLKELTHLPVITDPSHAAGYRRYVKPLTLASLVAGADGVMIEVHPTPDTALSDGEQSVTIEQFDDIMVEAKRLIDCFL